MVKLRGSSPPNLLVYNKLKGKPGNLKQLDEMEFELQTLGFVGKTLKTKLHQPHISKLVNIDYHQKKL